MEKLKIKNFRKVKSEWDINLSPVTFLTGKNNSGKSTIIKAILILKDYFDSGNVFELNLEGPNYINHRVNKYQNACNRDNYSLSNKFKNIIKFEITKSRQVTTIEFYESSKNTITGKLKKLEIKSLDNTLKFGLYSATYFNLDKQNNSITPNKEIVARNASNYIISIPDLRFTSGYQCMEARKILSKVLESKYVKHNSNTTENNFNWFFNNIKLETIAKHVLINFLKKKKCSEIDLKKLMTPGYLNKDKPALVNIKDKFEKSNYFDQQINIDGETYLLNKKWKEKYRDDLYDFLDNYHYYPNMNDLSLLYPKEIKKMGTNSLELMKYKSLLEQIDEIENNRTSTYHKISIRKNKIKAVKGAYKLRDMSLGSFIRNEVFSDRNNFSEKKDVKKKPYQIPEFLLKNWKLIDFTEIALNLNVDHLSPFRFLPKDFYPKNALGTNIESKMSEDIKIHKKIMSTVKKKEYHEFIKKYLRVFEIGESFKYVDTKVDGVTIGSSIIITDKKGSTQLKDKGFGSGQIFSIIMKVASMKFSNSNNSISNRTLLIEEPECNLHPALQSKLTKMFSEIADEDNIRIIAETHSEYIIRKSQNLIKDEPNKKSFSTYYIDDKKGIYPLIYNDNGTFKNGFGPGFFDESSTLAMDLF